MEITQLLNTYPNTSETFILNQFAGLLDEDYEIQVIAGNQPDAVHNHNIIKEYALYEDVIYANSPSTYLKDFDYLGALSPHFSEQGSGFEIWLRGSNTENGRRSNWGTGVSSTVTSQY